MRAAHLLDPGIDSMGGDVGCLVESGTFAIFRLAACCRYQPLGDAQCDEAGAYD